jgi:pimeloyl-ACP methyl ester carboxylesterase
VKGLEASFLDSRPTAWVLLRGLVREAGHWGDFVDQVARVTAPVPVWPLDLPGAGLHHDEASPSTVAEVATAVRTEAEQRAQAAGREPRFGLIGLSLGGMVALEWARHHPGESAALMLINSSAGSLSPPWHRARLRAWPGLLSIGFDGDLARRERKILALTCNLVANPDDLVARWVELARSRPVRLLNALRQIGAAIRYRPRLSPLTIPSRVLASAGDRLVNPLCSRRLAERLGSALSMHESAGHDLPADDPRWVCAELASLVSSLDAARPDAKSV